MKSFTLIFISTLLYFPIAAQNKAKTYTKDVAIQFKKRATDKMPDSVWIIFDRYDLTGPGIVNKIYTPQKNRLVLPNIPAGKYFVDVISFSEHHNQHFSTIEAFGKRRKNILSIRLDPIETYIQGAAVIPHQRVNFAELTIFRRRSH